MVALMAIPFVVAIIVGLGASDLAAHMPPAAATRVLCAAAVTCRSRAADAVRRRFARHVATRADRGDRPLVQTMPGNEIGRWPALRRPRGHSVVPLRGAPVLVAVRVARAARALAKALPAPASNLVVVDAFTPVAYALAGDGGRIVVSTGMLRALAADERRVLLAHEAAHLRHRHHLLVAVADIAAAANPLMRPAARGVRRTVERWADEVAAAEVGDRRVAARSVARAALARSQFRAAGSSVSGSAVALGLDDGDVPARVQALLAPPSGRQLRFRIGIVSATALCWLAGVAVTVWTHAVLEFAQNLPGH